MTTEKYDVDNCSTEEMANLILMILQRNFSAKHPFVEYAPGQLNSILQFEIAKMSAVSDQKPIPGGYGYEEVRGRASRELKPKFYEAVQLLRNRNLIMPEPGQSEDFVVLTENGKKEKTEEELLLAREVKEFPSFLRSKIPNVDFVVESYLLESIQAYQHNLLLCASFTLGVAAEKAILLLSESLVNFLNNSKIEKDFKNLWSIKGKADKLKQLLVAQNIKEQILMTAETKGMPIGEREKRMFLDFDTAMTTLYGCYRVLRNEVGHPIVPPKIDKNILRAQIMSFCKFAEIIFGIITLLEGKGK